MEAANLFKSGKPVIRPFKFIEDNDPGDTPYIWDAYKKGLIPNIPEDLEISDFAENINNLQDTIKEAWIVEDKVKGELVPVAFVICYSDGWLLEPHVMYFDSATPRSILRSYVAFMKKTKYRKDIGACFIRAEKHETKLINKVEQMGLVEYVGKIWGGKPTGNEYLYSVRCGRRH